MKSLLLVRHAKSSWDSTTLSDFDRPLNARGLRDAPMMAKRLFDKGISIDLMISSTAVRALTTAEYFKAAYKLADKQFVKLTGLYHADLAIFYDVISAQKDPVNSMAIFSHNPGITAMANSMGVTQIDNMPTCSIFAVHGHCKSWIDFEKSEKEFWFFDYPKL